MRSNHSRLAPGITRAIARVIVVERLQNLHAQPRDKVRASPLMDAPGFTRILEHHYGWFMDKLEPV
jgi:hypothetical protein